MSPALRACDTVRVIGPLSETVMKSRPGLDNSEDRFAVMSCAVSVRLFGPTGVSRTPPAPSFDTVKAPTPGSDRVKL